MNRQRTLGIVAHIDAGKTTLTEHILFDAGAQRWLGAVDDGTATMDWLRLEQERGISIVAAATRVEWRGFHLQIVDTPGHVDFAAEVERCLSVLDGVVVVLDSVRGVESQTLTVWRQADRWRCARIALVNKMDRPGADFAGVVRSLADRFGCRPVPVIVPLFDADGGFAGLGDAVRGRAVWFAGTVPAELQPRLTAELRAAHELALEAAADQDDALLDDFVAGRAIEPERVVAALRSGCLAGRLVPVTAGAALLDRGVDWLLDAVCDYLPSPLDRARLGSSAALPPADPSAPLAALVFKVEHDDGCARSYLRVFAGRLRVGDTVANSRSNELLRVEALWAMHSSHHREVPAAEPGEIVVLPVTDRLQTGDTLHAPGFAVRLPTPVFADPVLGQVFEPATPADEGPLRNGLKQLQADDPTLRVEADADSGRALVLGMGELHLEIVAARLRERGITAFSVSKPQVAMRATVARSAVAAAIAQAPAAAPAPWAEADVRVDPVADDERVEVVFDPVSPAAAGAVVARDLAAAARSGQLLGRPAMGLRLQVLALRSGDGGNEPLQQQAVMLATQKALALAGEVWLEPMVLFEVRCPASARAAVHADLAARGAILRSVSSGQLGALLQGRGRLRAFLGYATRLRSITQGQGEVQLQPDGYQQVES